MSTLEKMRRPPGLARRSGRDGVSARFFTSMLMIAVHLGVVARMPEWPPRVSMPRVNPAPFPLGTDTVRVGRALGRQPPRWADGSIAVPLPPLLLQGGRSSEEADAQAGSPQFCFFLSKY